MATRYGNIGRRKTVGTATLLSVEQVCVDCHDIHHWARTTKLFQAGRISSERYTHLRKHFRTVNGCPQEVFDDHFLQSARVWEERSSKRWKIDWLSLLLLSGKRRLLAVRGAGHKSRS
jgi:hypothetical protein